MMTCYCFLLLDFIETLVLQGIVPASINKTLFIVLKVISHSMFCHLFNDIVEVFLLIEQRLDFDLENVALKFFVFEFKDLVNKLWVVDETLVAHEVQILVNLLG